MGDLKRLGRYLTNRGMPNYFKETSISKSHKLHGVVEIHCLTLDFVGKMKASDSDQLQESFAKSISAIGELTNTDSRENNLGKRMFMITINTVGRQLSDPMIESKRGR